MKPENFDVQELVDYLKGTTDTLDGAIETLFPGMEWNELTVDEHDAIDNEIFLCPCGWWCETSEQDEEGNCQDCSELNDDE